MIGVAISRDGVPIRLPAERWSHIVEEHAEMAGLREEVLQTVADAEAVYEGHFGELLAVHTLEAGTSLVVCYKETSPSDGFIITAFLTSRADRLEKRSRRWPPMK